MEIKSFAEQILYGQSLEDKLLVPSTPLTDLHPSGHSATPKYPGRPDVLRLDRWTTQKKVPFPALTHVRHTDFVDDTTDITYDISDKSQVSCALTFSAKYACLS